MKNEYDFKGWDWTELVPVLDMEEEFQDLDNCAPGDYHQLETAFGARMAEKIRLYCYSHTEEETNLLVKHLRAYLQKVVEWEFQYGHYGPYYQGILNTEWNEVFLQIYALNLTGMWN